MSWSIVRNRLDNSRPENFDEGGVLCQCCPPFLELRRGGRYIVSSKDVVVLKLVTCPCNTHHSRAFTYQLRYAYHLPVNGEDVLDSDWKIFGTYTVPPNTPGHEFGEIDVASTLVGSDDRPIAFVFVVDVDYTDSNYPSETDCDFQSSYQIVDIICHDDPPPIPHDYCRDCLIADPPQVVISGETLQERRERITKYGY